MHTHSTPVTKMLKYKCFCWSLSSSDSVSCDSYRSCLDLEVCCCDHSFCLTARTVGEPLALALWIMCSMKLKWLFISKFTRNKEEWRMEGVRWEGVYLYTIVKTHIFNVTLNMSCHHVTCPQCSGTWDSFNRKFLIKFSVVGLTLLPNCFSHFVVVPPGVLSWFH